MIGSKFLTACFLAAFLVGSAAAAQDAPKTPPKDFSIKPVILDAPELPGNGVVLLAPKDQKLDGPPAKIDLHGFIQKKKYQLSARKLYDDGAGIFNTTLQINSISNSFSLNGKGSKFLLQAPPTGDLYLIEVYALASANNTKLEIGAGGAWHSSLIQKSQTKASFAFQSSVVPAGAPGGATSPARANHIMIRNAGRSDLRNGWLTIKKIVITQLE